MTISHAANLSEADLAAAKAIFAIGVRMSHGWNDGQPSDDECCEMERNDFRLFLWGYGAPRANASCAPEAFHPAPPIRIKDMHYTGQGWSHAFFDGKFYQFSDGDQYAPEDIALHFFSEVVTVKMLDEGQMGPDIASQAKQLEACEGVLRTIASYVGNGGHNATVVDPKVFEKKIMDGIASMIHLSTTLIPSFRPADEPTTAAPDAELSALGLKRRTWCYAQPPSAFEISACSCGNAKTQWSEYEGHLWCASCQKDFKPAHSGIFSGPIPVQTATSLGVSFDRIDLATGEIQKFDPDAGEYRPLGE